MAQSNVNTTLPMALQRPLEDYIDYWEKMTVRSVPMLVKMADPAMSFSNPFNRVRGVDSVMRVFTKMFEILDKPRYRVTDWAWGRDGYTVYLRWDLSGMRRGVPQNIQGVGEVTFTTEGKILSHIDHWDSVDQVLMKEPIIGAVVRRIYRKFSI